MTFRQATHDEPTVFEHGRFWKDAEALKDLVDRIGDGIPDALLRKDLDLPSMTEGEVVRHFVKLSQMNHGVDTGFYPLGSCTMKYNPKVSERLAGLPGFTSLHPDQTDEEVQGALELMHRLEEQLCIIGGVDAVSLQPAAGAHGEFLGMLVARAYHESIGEGPEMDGTGRHEVIVPDTAHGTNPASAAMAGYDVVEIRSNEDGTVDLDALQAALGPSTAAFMLTNPNTLGIFEPDVERIAAMVHEAGALLYYDGANLNAIMGKTTPGAMGFDIVHFNLHKTFGTPHGGGGPGSGPVGVTSKLERFLPVPRIVKKDGLFRRDWDCPESVGKIHSYLGNFGILLRAHVYIELFGNDLEKVSEMAVLNSNYLAARLKEAYPMPFKELRKHEFVLSGSRLKECGARTIDLAKHLADEGFHPPTVYFPLIVDEAIMIEPTETESLETLDAFAETMIRFAGDDECKTMKDTPKMTSVQRVDEVKAAKEMVLTWDLRKDADNE